MSIGLGIVASLLLLGATAPDPVRVDRARSNYQALMVGSKQVADLTPQERIDVEDLLRILQGQQRDTRTPDQKCVEEEVRRAGGAPSGLARQLIDLKCRPPGTPLSQNPG